MPTENKKNTTPAEETVTYTKAEIEQQLRDAYMNGQKTGLISAIKQVRSEINDYLSDLLASIKNEQ